MCQGPESTLTHNHTQTTTPQMWIMSPESNGLDTEAGMLSGISRKRSLRSSPYWFTEFCNSQCLSQFAAPFIVVRAETSIAESCKKMQKWATTSEGVNCKETSSRKGMTAAAETGNKHPCCPAAFEFLHKGIDAISIPAHNLTQNIHSC